MEGWLEAKAGSFRGSNSFVNKRNHTRLGWTGIRLSSSIQADDGRAEHGVCSGRILRARGGSVGLGTGIGTPALRGANFRCLMVLALSVGFGAIASAAQGSDWIWAGGSNAVPTSCTYPIGCGQAGIYGTEGSAGIVNVPGGRYAADAWPDSSGNLWMFSGVGNDSNGVPGGLNDLWKFDVATGEWTWVGGNNALPGKWTNEPPSFGTLGTAAASNTPGFREYANNWTDGSGSLWLFGGSGYNTGEGNDLWKFQPSSSEWTWVGGVNPASPGLSNGSGSYGDLGQPSLFGWPGTRSESMSCTDSKGRFWLFGGSGIDSVGNGGLLNDLWVYDTSIGEWAWMAGSTTVLPPGYSGDSGGGPNPVYGTQGVPAAGNTPGGRQAGACWFDAGGNLWLFGGYGQHPSGATSDWNDLWEFNVTTLEWAWMSGVDALLDCTPPASICGNPGVYGTLGTPAPENLPGARTHPATWTDLSGNLWLFGGLGYDQDDDYGELNDLWEFSPFTRQWTWEGGSSTIANCVPALTGLLTCGDQGAYGTQGNPSGANTPGGRDSALSWVDTSGNLWLFGGEGYDASGNYGDLNDLWMIQRESNTLPASSAPTFSVPSGTYLSAQMVTITDATADATIYYSTDGTPPTMDSAVYSSPVSVTTTEAIEAIAVGDGHAPSTIATASYLLPPSFTVAVNPGTLQLSGNTSGNVAVSITPVNSFSAPVSFNCLGLPFGSSCSFSPATVTPAGGAATTTLTITVPATSASLHRATKPELPVIAAALAMGLCGWRRGRRSLFLLALGIVVLGTGVVSGCGGGVSSGGGGGGSTPVTSTVTVTAKSGSLQQTASITLTVN